MRRPLAPSQKVNTSQGAPRRHGAGLGGPESSKPADKLEATGTSSHHDHEGGTGGRANTASRAAAAAVVPRRQAAGSAYLSKLQRAGASARERALANLVLECGMICGCSGMAAQEFDAKAGDLLEKCKYSHGALEREVLALAMSALSRCASRVEPDSSSAEALPAMLRKVEAMQAHVALNAEIDGVKSVIAALWLAHGDNDAVDMEVELLRYLESKHDGCRDRMAAGAVSLVESLNRLASHDVDIRVFGKILRNAVDQGFWRVRTKLRQTVRELAAQGRSPAAIVAHMYNDRDARELLHRLEARRGLLDLEDLLLEFHLERHEAATAGLAEEYRAADEEFKSKISFSAFVRGRLLAGSAAATP